MGNTGRTKRRRQPRRLKPPPKFLAACRRVLGDDSPPTVNRAIRDRDPHMNEVYALAARDPTRWLCSAIDESGTPRLWANGVNEQEARKRAELAVTEYQARMQSYREMVPHSQWAFVTYPPDADAAG